MTHVPPFPQVPGGDITALPLNNQYVLEGWHLHPQPYNHDDPCSEPIYHLIANTPDEALKLVDEFVTDLTELLATR